MQPLCLLIGESKSFTFRVISGREGLALTALLLLCFVSSAMSSFVIHRLFFLNDLLRFLYHLVLSPSCGYFLCGCRGDCVKHAVVVMTPFKPMTVLAACETSHLCPRGLRLHLPVFGIHYHVVKILSILSFKSAPELRALVLSAYSPCPESCFPKLLSCVHHAFASPSLAGPRSVTHPGSPSRLLQFEG